MKHRKGVSPSHKQHFQLAKKLISNILLTGTTEAIHATIFFQQSKSHIQLKHKKAVSPSNKKTKWRTKEYLQIYQGSKSSDRNLKCKQSTTKSI